MHIVVCIKQVPDTTEIRVDPVTNTLRREGVPSIINPFDVHAVEEAVRVKERYGGKVTLLSMGPPQARDALKKALAFGADSAILLTDRAFAGSDTLATGYTLAGAIARIAEQEPVDLVFCGKQAIDGDTAQVGPGIARRLGFSQLTYVMKIERLEPEKREIVVHRKLADGHAVVAARLPALLTVVKDINQPRRASLPDLIRAARYQVITWGKQDLPVEEERLGLKGSPTTVHQVFAPPVRPGGELIPGADQSPRHAARELVDKLIGIKVIANT